MNGPQVSLVVTTYNEGPALLKCLRSLAAQHGAENSEIVLVDDRSTDGTAEAVSALALPNLRFIRIDHFDHPLLTARQVALDTAFRAARGELICLTDADAEVPPEWMNAMCAPMISGGADLVAGAVCHARRSPEHPVSMAIFQAIDSAYYLGVCAVLDRMGFASGVIFCNCAFRRDLYLETGGFEAIGFGLTEDLRFARAAHRLGKKLAFVPSPLPELGSSPSWSAFVRRGQRISDGGNSALLALLAGWMVLWVVLGIGSLALPSVFLIPLLIRHFAGAGFLAWWLVRTGGPRYLPGALIYEPLALVLGLIISWQGRKRPTVGWGGLTYGKSGNPDSETA